MAVSDDTLAKIIVETYKSFPSLVNNRSLSEVFDIIAQNETVRKAVAGATGLDSDIVRKTTQTFFYILPYWRAYRGIDRASASNSTPCVSSPTKGEFTYLCVGPAIAIILLLSFLKPRVNTIKSCGMKIVRPGLCIPLNLLDSYENRLGYACAFGATVSRCLRVLFFSDYSEIFDERVMKIQSDPATPAWMGMFWRILAMFVIGVAYYPFFACLSTDYKILGGLLGSAYSAVWLIITAYQVTQCQERYLSYIYPGDLLAIDFPTHMCLLFLTFYFFYYAVKEIVKRYQKAHTASFKEAAEEDDWKNCYKYKYVKNLIKPLPIEEREALSHASHSHGHGHGSHDALSFKEKVKSMMYHWKPDFKYSTRVACTYTVGLLAVYEIACGFVVLGGIFYKYTLNYLEDHPKLLDDIGLGTYIDSIEKYIEICFIAWYVALGLTCVQCVLLVANMLTWYRKHVIRLQRGDKEFLPPHHAVGHSASMETLACLKYSGYQVAYLAWAFVINHFVMFLVAALLGIEFIQPIVDGSMDSFVWTQVLKLWPAIFVSLLIFLIQFLLAKFVFLIDRGSSMSLDNRRLFHICAYFLFFFNTFLGLISCLLRIILGAALGIVFLARTQKSVVSRDFEDYDPGFHAYVGYLLLEHHHSNPVLVTFCRVLIMSLRQRYWGETPKTDDDQQDIELDEEKQLSRRRARIRWSLAVTLINNPNLCELRKRDKSPEKAPVRDLKVKVNGFGVSNGAAYHNKANDELANGERESGTVGKISTRL
ncbi:stimulated by retinoic acid gene 6 protein-like isoform X2 [Nematostella vectensis]|uniref:stimulated by retinoic acid gene 6 protein-like isoform X2 n=1 Tax=Nematostella vectensis TaxID=45351 RepID=UPI001390496F|nr:stimulated by retinoic acid gene 6 protein-like isoform X2 [Nematostella vectensis]